MTFFKSLNTTITFFVAFLTLIVATVLIVFTIPFSSANAASLFGEATFSPVPTEREGGSPLPPEDIGHFRAYLLLESGEWVYLVDKIPYVVGENEWTFSYAVNVDTPTGVYTICVSTVDTLGLESDECIAPLLRNFTVPKPKGPANLTATFNITVSD